MRGRFRKICHFRRVNAKNPYGPCAVSARCYALITEELARGCMSLAGAFGGTRWFRN